MVDKRSVAASVILTIVTCGIYGIYWFIVLTNDIGRLSNDHSFTGGKNFLLCIVTCGIWSFVWAYQVGQHLAEAQRQRGYTPTDNSVIYIVLTIFGLGIVVNALAQSDVNKLA